MNAQPVAIYARVSSEQQAEAGTIESQLAALRQRVAQDGYHLSEELTFIDEGYRGTILIRPELEQLRDVVALHGLARLYVLDPDRLARKYAYQVLLLDEFQQAGVEVVFLNRALGQSPEDELLVQVQGMIAEYERAKIIERSRRGKRHAAQTGRVSVLSGAPSAIVTSASKKVGDKPATRSAWSKPGSSAKFLTGWGVSGLRLEKSVVACSRLAPRPAAAKRSGIAPWCGAFSRTPLTKGPPPLARPG